MPPLTQLLQSAEQGEASAAAALLPLLYDELRQIAARQIAGEKPGQTLNATALVHEAYLRLIPDGQDRPRWQNRRHFVAAAAEAMRRILIDAARRKKRLKHGGGRERESIEPDLLADVSSSEQLLEIDDALNQLAASEPDIVNLVKLRYFVGLTIPEAAAAMGISERSADAWWAYARAWLYDALGGEKSLTHDS